MMTFEESLREGLRGESVITRWLKRHDVEIGRSPRICWRGLFRTAMQ